MLYPGESIETNRGSEDRPGPPSRGNKCSIHHPHRLPRPAARDDKDGHPRLLHSDAAIPHDSTRALGLIRWFRPILINPELEDPGVSNCRRKDRQERPVRREIIPERQMRRTESLWKLWMIGEATSPSVMFFKTVSTVPRISWCFNFRHYIRVLAIYDAENRCSQVYLLQTSCSREKLIIICRKSLNLYISSSWGIILTRKIYFKWIYIFPFFYTFHRKINGTKFHET